MWRTNPEQSQPTSRSRLPNVICITPNATVIEAGAGVAYPDLAGTPQEAAATSPRSTRGGCRVSELLGYIVAGIL